MKTIELKMYLDIEDGTLEEMNVLKHHIEYLLDLDNWSNIQNVYGVSVKEVENR